MEHEGVTEQYIVKEVWLNNYNDYFFINFYENFQFFQS